MVKNTKKRPNRILNNLILMTLISGFLLVKDGVVAHTTYWNHWVYIGENSIFPDFPFIKSKDFNDLHLQQRRFF